MTRRAACSLQALMSGVAAVFLATAISACSATRDNEPARQVIYERTTPKAVQEVLEDVEFAIGERNFRITGQLHVGRGIRERDNIDFPDYEVILFCNLGLARQMLELDPGYINYCPGRITVRRGAEATHIAAPLLPEGPGQNAALAALVRNTNLQLRAIVDFGTEHWAERSP